MGKQFKLDLKVQAHILTSLAIEVLLGEDYYRYSKMPSSINRLIFEANL